MISSVLLAYLLILQLGMVLVDLFQLDRLQLEQLHHSQPLCLRLVGTLYKKLSWRGRMIVHRAISGVCRLKAEAQRTGHTLGFMFCPNY
jgi:hypothetical protein